MTSDAPQTIGDLLALTDQQYRRYTAIHEIGHAITGLATGNGIVTVCEINIIPGAVANGFTDYGWGYERPELETRLVFLHGGLLAQERWLHETGLWTLERSRGVRFSAQEDLALMQQLGADEAAIRVAREEAADHLQQHWQGLLKAALYLDSFGSITGQAICDILNAAAPQRPHTRRAEALAEAEARGRPYNDQMWNGRWPAPEPPPPGDLTR